MDNSLSKDAHRMREYRKSQQYKDKASERREKRKLYKRELRRKKGCELKENITLYSAIKNMPKPLTVLDLIVNEQKNYWIERRKTNEGKAEYQKHLYNTNINTRIIQKEKRQRNKFKDSGNYVEHISAKQIQNRFKLFKYCCAYCGSFEGLDIQMEHVVPRSKNGAHCMANIIPACRRCNTSKYNYDMVTWYKQQTFYTKERLNKIKDILCRTPYPVKQIDLFPEWMINN
tara:strand:- start:65 stop:754 length:690 start_codon:yes stop_codon:yes gene_type:complete